jgi:hypothetical protein
MMAGTITRAYSADSGSLGGLGLHLSVAGPASDSNGQSGWPREVIGAAQPFSVASSKARSSWKCRSVASGS